MIKVLYLDKDISKLVKTTTGDCIDLRVSSIGVNGGENYFADRKKNTPLAFKKNDVLFVKFGVALQVNERQRINIYARSSTFKNFGLILTNSIGIIDNSYSSNQDEICGMFYALKDGVLCHNERIAQFEVVRRMTQNTSEIVEVKELHNKQRGGYGTSGIK